MLFQTGENTCRGLVVLGNELQGRKQQMAAYKRHLGARTVRHRSSGSYILSARLLMQYGNCRNRQPRTTVSKTLYGCLSVHDEYVCLSDATEGGQQITQDLRSFDHNMPCEMEMLKKTDGLVTQTNSLCYERAGCVTLNPLRIHH